MVCSKKISNCPIHNVESHFNAEEKNTFGQEIMT